MDAVIADRLTKSNAAIVPTIRIFGDFLNTRNLLQLTGTSGKKYLTPEALMQVTAAES